MSRSTGYLAAACCALAALAPVRGRAEPPRSGLAKEYQNLVAPVLERHCLACHGGKKPKGDLDLARVGANADDLPRWELVLERLRAGEMPPREAKSQPTAEERKAVVAWVERFRADEARRNAGDPGVVLARRLSNAEYDNTIRDLTGVDVRPARDFPVDPANTAGFDNTGESLRMSPALVTKHLAAARSVADHALLTPDGFTFAPFPVLTDTDRDKFCVRRIIDFYLSQPTDSADYFRAAWRYRYGIAKTLADASAAERVSPKYLATLWEVLGKPGEETGPLAALRALFDALPSPEMGRPDVVQLRCDAMRDFVLRLRERVKVKVDNLPVSGLGAGSQPFVLWKDRTMAANRCTYGGGGLRLISADFGLGPVVAKALTAPVGEAERRKCEATFERFCSVFPDAFYVKERARIFLDPKEDRENTGRLLSAGFHNQMGYFRDDQPLCELILDEAGKKQLDKLWDEFEFASDLPARMHSGFIWYERAESKFIADERFDFARAEDKDATSPAKFQRLTAEYLKKTRQKTNNETVIKAVEEHFARTEANIRRVEQQRRDAEPAHVRALQAFAQRAYRRRLKPAESEGIAAFYQSLRRDGLGHDDAVRDTLASILMSPHFCFRVDLPTTFGEPPASAGGDSAKRVEPLGDEALASRVSYFLWSTMPDAELLDLAAKGTLHKPEVLRAQVRRMLNDERVRGLAVDFGGSWLDFRRFEEHNAVDRSRYPQFDAELRRAMAEEPVRFLVDLIQRDRPVYDLLDAKHSFVNAALAKHYGMPGPANAVEWVRIDDGDTYGRGGLLPMAVFLTRNSPGLRTSPVKRGYWVVTRLLGERIPPPPPNVPEIPADEKKLGNLTLRETLVRHRADKTCAACHERFDSFGLAFEGFGPVGERRSVDLLGNAIDTRVTFPSGAEGDGVAGLREFFRGPARDAFVDNLCRKLLAYGLGRTLIPSDDATIAAMKANLARDGFQFASLIDTIVTSPQFLNRRAAGAPKE